MISKEGNGVSDEIKQLVGLDKIRFFLEEEQESEVLKYTPLLYMAVASGHKEVVRALLENGADINAQNNKRDTALHLAISDQNLDMVRILLDNGASSGIKNQKGNTPLHIAVNHSSDVKACTKGIGKNSLLVATATAKQISNQSNEQTRENT